MVVMHIAYGLDLIALTMGTGLLVWSIKNPGKGSWIAKLFGSLVMLFSIFSIVCIFSCAMKGSECRGPARAADGTMMAPGDQPAADSMKKMDRKKS